MNWMNTPVQCSVVIVTGFHFYYSRSGLLFNWRFMGCGGKPIYKDDPKTRVQLYLVFHVKCVRAEFCSVTIKRLSPKWSNNFCQAIRNVYVHLSVSFCFSVHCGSNKFLFLWMGLRSRNVKNRFSSNTWSSAKPELEIKTYALWFVKTLYKI